MNLHGKTAIVTGSGRGIGKGCAVQLAKAGADVIINDRPGSPDLANTVAEIEALGRKCTAIEEDVFNRAGCESLIQRALEACGTIDILVSNPAYSRRAPFLEYEPEEFEKTIAATLVAGFHMSQLVARHMVERRQGGKIVFISSVQADMPFALSAAYSTAKAGLNHFARTVAVELSEHRINVNVIQPGWIDTPGEHITFGAERIAAEGPSLPWGRLGTPDDIGKAAAFLASEDADYMTGSVVTVDGGFRWKDCRSIPRMADAD